ncbi:MAG: type I-D CRISPR-associated protein Cas5/Csc1 [Candidatus Thorarchaeota archaeon]|nr:type I-D CRISPR-associated protein Cas5/Csc1 [Candidatus Thorarchaeota archaeon]
MSEPVVSVVLMTSHDFLFYASQDYGSVARPADVIGNYALMYALNRNIPEIRRLVSGSTPFYDVDLPKMNIYATPATFTDFFVQVSASKTSNWLDHRLLLGEEISTRWNRFNPTLITWNSIGESLLDKMSKDRYNLPKTGGYYKHPPLANFYFYTVGPPPPSVIRIGKKYTTARIKHFALEYTIKEGRFSPTCPVTVSDLPDETEILQGSILTIPPVPVITDSVLEGAYLEATDPKGLVHRIPIPRTDRFPMTWGS